jgi:hypothetical protein
MLWRRTPTFTSASDTAPAGAASLVGAKAYSPSSTVRDPGGAAPASVDDSANIESPAPIKHALRKGAEIATVQEMLGHSSNAVTRRYAGHVRRAEAARRMP